MGNLPSCVECVDDETFPRTFNGMVDSVSMQILPPNPTNQIPMTSETTEDLVQLSAMKPLGVTLCDSDTSKGVFVTGIKKEGNVAKVTQSLSVGMLLLELNGVDVTSETLENVIKTISDAPSEKRLILKFSGTKPVAEVVAPVDTAIVPVPTSAPCPPVPATEKKEQDVESDKKETVVSVPPTSTSTAAREEDKEDTSISTKHEGGEKDLKQKEKEQPKEEKEEKEEKKGETEGKVEAPQVVTTSKLEQQQEEEQKKKTEETCERVSTPEQESFGSFSESSSTQNCDTGLSTQSMDTVDITTPPPPTLVKEGARLGSKDLDSEFCNVSLADEEENSSPPSTETDKEQEQEQEGGSGVEEQTQSTPPPHQDDKEVFKCSRCDTNLSRSAFSSNQLKKGAKRRCKECK